MSYRLQFDSQYVKHIGFHANPNVPDEWFIVRIIMQNDEIRELRYNAAENTINIIKYIGETPTVLKKI